MQTIPLDPIPNQSLSAQLDGRFWSFRITDVGGVMAVDVTRDNVTLLSGVRVLAGELLLPFPYLEDGNFILLTDGDALPAYDQFGVTQTLVYVSAEEMAVIADA